MRRLAKSISETLWSIAFSVALLIVVRGGVAETRYIPSGSMEPTLQIGDLIIVEKITALLGRPIKRGDVLVFYPPASEMGGRDLSSEPLWVLGRLTGLCFLPSELPFVKRVVGLPGDKISVIRGIGVFLNDQQIGEPYVKERPDYDLAPLLVPENKLFMMGDNRNNSEDSHVWGCLDQARVLGRVCALARGFSLFPR